MLKAIQLNMEEIGEIMACMPEHLKEKVQTLMDDAETLDSGLHVIKHFFAQYEEDNVIDFTIAFLCASLISRIIKSVNKLSIDSIGSGKVGATGKDMALITLDALKVQVNMIEEVLQSESKQTH